MAIQHDNNVSVRTGRLDRGKKGSNKSLFLLMHARWWSGDDIFSQLKRLDNVFTESTGRVHRSRTNVNVINCTLTNTGESNRCCRDSETDYRSMLSSRQPLSLLALREPRPAIKPGNFLSIGLALFRRGFFLRFTRQSGLSSWMRVSDRTSHVGFVHFC